MKLSLLDICQDTLNDLDSDNVNSIFDTVESEQIAAIARTTYYEMLSRRDYPHLHRLIDLSSSVDVGKPTHMKIETAIQGMDSLSYNIQEELTDKINYKLMERIRPQEFLSRTNKFNSLNANVDLVTDWSGVDILVKNDKFPDYYTSFDDEWLVFDSHNEAFDTILQTSKVQAFGVVEPLWEVDDFFVPDLPSQHFPSYLAEVKSVCFIVLKQQASQKHEQQSARGQRWLSRQGRKVDQGLNYPNYGRHGKVGSSRNRNPNFAKDK